MLNYKKKWFLLCHSITVSQCLVCEGGIKENQGFSHWVWIVFVTPTPNILKMPALPTSALLHSHYIASFIYASGFLFSNVAFTAWVPPWEEEELLRYWRITFFSDCGMVPSMEENWTKLTLVPPWFSVDISFGHSSDFSSWLEAHKETSPDH